MNHNIILFFLGVLGLIIWINYAVAGDVSRKGRTIFFVTLLNIYVVFRDGFKKLIIRWFC